MANVWVPPVEINTLPPGAKVLTFGHRSGAETHMRCPRAYYYNYEYLGHGINSYPTPLHFKVGSAVHLGLAAMLLGEGIDSAVEQALGYFKSGRAFQLLQSDQQIEQEVLVHGLLYAFWVWAYPTIERDYEVLCVETGAVEYIPITGEWPICGQYIQDGDAQCARLHSHDGPHSVGPDVKQLDYIAMQSRPDAILRNRKTNEVAGWSWKTIDDPTDMRRSQFHNDLQGFMELWYGERVLEKMRGMPVTREELKEAIDAACSRENVLDVLNYLQLYASQLEDRARAARDIPTQIDYIQTVFLVKGKRQLLDAVEMPWINSAGPSSETDEFGGYAPDKIYKQMSPLCYRYRNANPEVVSAECEYYKSGPRKGKPKEVDHNEPGFHEETWAYSFYKPGNETQSRISPKWLTSPIQPDQIRDWIDRLAAGSVYPSTMNDDRNPHSMEKLIKFEAPLYRNAAKAAAHVQQQKNRYVQIAQSVRRVNEAIASRGVSLQSQDMEILDAEFPQHLINCRTPYKCGYFDFCHTPRESEIDFQNVPVGFEVREAHHAKEVEMREGEENV